MPMWPIWTPPCGAFLSQAAVGHVHRDTAVHASDERRGSEIVAAPNMLDRMSQLLHVEEEVSPRATPRATPRDPTRPHATP
eukprot:2028338-Prymnesium_polylepis.1